MLHLHFQGFLVNTVCHGYAKFVYQSVSARIYPELEDKLKGTHTGVLWVDGGRYFKIRTCLTSPRREIYNIHLKTNVLINLLKATIFTISGKLTEMERSQPIFVYVYNGNSY